MKRILLACTLGCVFFVVPELHAQFNQLETEKLRLIYYGQAQSYLVRHTARSYENAFEFYDKIYGYSSKEKVTVLLHDLYDYGNAGAGTAPRNMIALAIAPFDYAFETSPANERLNAMMNHELAHIVTNDQSAGRDRVFRSLFRGKVLEDEDEPLSILYGYLTSPRRSSPRWYREGVAVFLETWMSGGLGRALGGYDEMVFRTMVREGSRFFDDVGIEAEGTQIDFQVGVNAYLYGTRFMSYLALKYGPETVIEWTARQPGSRAYFASQFEAVYGLPLTEAWQNWIDWEHQWQENNLDAVRKNPVTSFRPLSPTALGSVSRAHYDSGNLYVAVNYPGQVAHLARLDLSTGRSEMLHEVKGGSVFNVCALAYDRDAEILFYTTDNGQWRDIRSYNLSTGKERLLLKDARIGDLAFNRADRSLWGVRHFNGISTIARIPHPYTRWEQVFSWPYGQDFYDADVSPDGRFIVGALAEISGRQSLVMLSVDSLLSGNHSYETLFDFDTSNPANFTFSADGGELYGSSYYSGVSNIFRLDLESRKMAVLSNAETGLFRPFPVSEDSIFAFRFGADGFQPGLIPNEPVHRVSAIKFLGQEIVERHPVVRDWVAGSPGRIQIDTLTLAHGPYRALNHVRMVSAYPVVEGYKDQAAFGVRMNLSDPISLHRIHLTATVTPWSNPDEQFHGRLEYGFRDLTLSAGYNASSFFDLFGPTKTSRKGYGLRAELSKTIIRDQPRTLSYSLMAGAFGGFEALPDYQNVAATFDRMQTARASLRYTHYRSSLGSVDKEKGFGWSLNGSSNFVNGTAYPRSYATLDTGFLFPLAHLTTWFRGAAGYSYGDRANPFANFYFGGFGNNWVDRGDEKRFRSYDSFPGLDLNAAGGTTFVKLTNEWILPPVRLRRAGGVGLYAQWLRMSLFGGGLVTNPDLPEDRPDGRRLYGNLGAQLDLRLVLFSHLKSTISFGVAGAFDEDGRRHDEVMASLKIL